MDAATSAVVALGATETKRAWRLPSISSVTILGGCLLIIFGAKIWFISRYGSATPFGDQWDAEARNLYKPYFDETLHFWSLFDAHNEHRIFFSRLLSLGLLLLEHRWDPLLQMVVNAGLHVAAIGVLLVMVTRQLPEQLAAAVAIFTAAVLAIPYGYENTLWGIQSLVYFHLLFAFLAVWLHSHSPAWSPLWISATALAVASYFNISSGALTPLVLSAMSISQIILGGRKSGFREWTGIAAQCTLALVMILFIPRLPYHDSLKAHSIEQFVSAFLTAAAWPLSRAYAVVLHAPMIALIASLIKDRPHLRDSRWIFVGLWIWLGTQFVSLAYGRAVYVIPSRYLDFFLVGLILNFTALLRLLPDRPRLSVSFLASVWLLAISIGAAHEAVLKADTDVAEWHRRTDIETRNVRGYVTTGDFDFLKEKTLPEIPYPDPDRLRFVLDAPEVRAILPPTLVDDGVPVRRPVVSLRDLYLSHGPFLVVVGITLFFFGMSCSRQEVTTTDTS
jgi:hypothetical protein